MTWHVLGDLIFLTKGMIIGLCIAVPVGPIGLLCIRRTLNDGPLYGLISGIGAATADAFYGMVGGFGVTCVSNFLIHQATWLHLLGGLFLCFLGVKTFLSKPAKKEAALKGGGLVLSYLTTFFYTLTNPMTIFSFAAIFAAVGIAEKGRDFVAASTLVLGVFLGSSLWWLILSGGVGLFRERISLQWLWKLNRLAGALITGFGLFELLRPLI